MVRQADENLERLAAAMRDLGARLRVEGLSDEEVAALPVRLDGLMLGRTELTTWRTDAGNFDVLADLPARDGRRLRYEDLVTRAQVLLRGEGLVVRAAALEDIIAFEGVGRPPKGP